MMAALQEPKITMESTPEVENLGTDAESNEDTGAEKNEPAENEVDKQSKNLLLSTSKRLFGWRRVELFRLKLNQVLIQRAKASSFGQRAQRS